MNKLSSKLTNGNPYQQQQQQPQMTTDALIVNSNSHLVSDDIILQLQEQFGDTKQIYILNSSNNSLISSSSYNNSNSLQPSNQPVQYLVVDKDVDINLILQDPNIFNQAFNNNTNNNQSQQIRQNNMNKNTPCITPTTSSSINTPSSTSTITATTLIEESVQRVQAPPPKRKKFEFKFENKKNSYQDAFLRFLAGEKQPSLDIASEQINKKPKDNIGYSLIRSNNCNQTQTIVQSQSPSSPQSSVPSSTISTTQNYTTITINNNNNNNNNNQSSTTTTTGTTTLTNDKENYYNSSRRENLLPLNNYEYRNSYKDHYDNQGVRINPAILKNLPYSPTVTTPSAINTPTPSTSSSNPQIKPIYQRSNVNIQTTTNQQNQSPSKIIVTKSNSKNLISKIATNNEQNKIIASNSNVLLDHTYKMHDGNKTKFNNKINSNVQIGNDGLNMNENFSINDLNPNQMITDNNHHINITPVVGQVDDQQVSLEAPVQVQNSQSSELIIEEVRFLPGEFLIHKSTFSGDFENYDIWCVLNDEYLQKYEPVLLSTGERCHQSADVLAQYTQDKSEFLLVKVEEKGKTEQNNIVVGVLNEYEPKNNKAYSKILLQQTIAQEIVVMTNTPTAQNQTLNNMDVKQNDVNNLISPSQSHHSLTSTATNNQQQVILVTYDDLKRTFDVFIQVLLSQYLNSEFLLKIKELNDEYFKPSIELMDTILNEKYDLVLNYLNEFLSSLSNIEKKNLKLKPLYKLLLENKPKLEINMNVTSSSTNKKCESLMYEDMDGLDDELDLLNNYDLTLLISQQHLIKFTGHSYNLDNLQYYNKNNDEISDTIDLINNSNGYTNNNSNSHTNGQFFVCSKMLNITQMLHSLRHFKINYFELCSQKIESVKAQTNRLKVINDDSNNKTDENSTNTELLNYCLADNKWLLEMFEKFKQLLFEVDSIINSTSTSTSTTTTNTASNNGVTNSTISKLNDFTNHNNNNNNHHLNHMDIDLINTNINDQKKSLNINNNIHGSQQLKNENDHINKNSKTILIDDTNHKS